MDILSQLDHYVELLEKAKARTEDEKTAIALVSEIAKDRRTALMQRSKSAQRKPVTDLQKNLMDELGINYPENLSTREASALISAKLGETNGTRQVKVVH